MGLEVASDKAICTRCGKQYSKRKGFFPTSYSENYKGLGYTHICNTCINSLYSKYLTQCGSSKDAVRQVCRKLDLYWHESIFNRINTKSTARTVMTQYITKLNSVALAGRSYDDTLLDEGTLWSFSSTIKTDDKPETPVEPLTENEEPVPEDVIAFWGAGYTADMYKDLEQRRQYWMSRFPNDIDLDIGTEALIRQICNLEIDINRDRVAGKSIDKSVNALNNLLGSASLKPTQRKEDLDSSVSNTPLGVWLYRFENERPLPDIDDELKDVNGLKKYVFTWMGHLCKMMGIKNGYTRLYEDEINRLRVERPEYDDEDDETLLIDSFSEEESDG